MAVGGPALGALFGLATLVALNTLDQRGISDHSGTTWQFSVTLVTAYLSFFVGEHSNASGARDSYFSESWFKHPTLTCHVISTVRRARLRRLGRALHRHRRDRRRGVRPPYVRRRARDAPRLAHARGAVRRSTQVEMAWRVRVGPLNHDDVNRRTCRRSRRAHSSSSSATRSSSCSRGCSLASRSRTRSTTRATLGGCSSSTRSRSRRAPRCSCSSGRFSPSSRAWAATPRSARVTRSS